MMGLVPPWTTVLYPISLFNPPLFGQSEGVSARNLRMHNERGYSSKVPKYMVCQSEGPMLYGLFQMINRTHPHRAIALGT